MLPNEPQFKRYRFNSKQQRQNNQQAAICVWISGIIIVIFLILGGIKFIGHYQSVQPAAHSHISRHVNKSNASMHHDPKPKSEKPATGPAKTNRQQVTSSTDDDHHRLAPPQPAFHRQRFASVNNAKAWAKATQQRWLHQGYTDYRVSSDGQGNYYLQFTK